MRYIRVDRRGPYMWITFDRPGKLNVLHTEDLPGLRDVIVNLHPGVTGLVFTGAGPAAFSAGMNIETFVGMDRPGAKSFIGQLAGIMQAIREARVVTVAAVSGYCLGAAFELALACDLRVVTTTAAFGLPEIKVGVPSVIDAALLPGFVGLSRAREMILTGDSYRLDQLPTHSIANIVTEPGLLAGTTESLLERTATHTRTVTAAQRRLFSAWLNIPLDAAVQHSMDEFAETFEARETRDQIAYHYRRITGRSGPGTYR
jgi:enoyl-CoA hydratase